MSLRRYVKTDGWWMMGQTVWKVAALFVVTVLMTASTQEMQGYTQQFRIEEEKKGGFFIGTAGDGIPEVSPPFNKLISPNGGSVISESFRVDLNTGKMWTKKPLDREFQEQYTFYLVPSSSLSAAVLRILINLTDVNDNGAVFSHLQVKPIPENAPVNMKIPLGSVKDKDTDQNGIQKCEIISGNVGQAFRLETRKSGSFETILDLLVNRVLDYEVTPYYRLVIKASDGGTPQKTGTMVVDIAIEDQNDYQPKFNLSKYSALIPENATVGTSVLQVYAEDLDSGENGKVRYSLNYQTDPEKHFVIDPVTGIVKVNKPLDFETKPEFSFAVVASDNGSNPQSASAALEIFLKNINENPANITLTFLQSGTKHGRVPENAAKGTYVARISISDPDSPNDFFVNANVTLIGGKGVFGLVEQNKVVFLVIVSEPPDREITPFYNLTVVATDSGSPPLHAMRSFTIWIDDINDNVPAFTKDVYDADVREAAESGTFVIKVSATDTDDGDNARITYSLADTTQSSWFQIDSRSGIITTKEGIDCEIEAQPVLIVVATDNGDPPRSSTASVVIHVQDVNDKQPEFDQSFYSVKVVENVPVGQCILTVSAVDPECGANAPVTYDLVNKVGRPPEFSIGNETGRVCISSPLDYEQHSTYDFFIRASDRDGLYTTAPVRVVVEDVNDNHPSFNPVDYNINVQEGVALGSLLTVRATDADSNSIGTVVYSIHSGNDQGFFTIDPSSGVIFLARPLPRGERVYNLRVQATDGGELQAHQPARVTISVIDANVHPATFSHLVYNFSIAEGAAVSTLVGEVLATPQSGQKSVKYSILSGGYGWFEIDAVTGAIASSGTVDREILLSVLLNVQAEAGNPPVYSTAQVNITILDANDNSPSFSLLDDRLEIHEREDQAPGSTVYIAQARDPDAGNNGTVRYKLLNNPDNLFNIEPISGEIRLKNTLDFEKRQKFELRIVGYDLGTPKSRSSTMTLVISLKDVNDNPPTFSKSVYDFHVTENSPISSSRFAQITATDLDSDENGRVYYTFEKSRYTSLFGINPPDGSLYVRGPLDREEQDLYVMTVIATDYGKIPSKLSSTAVIRIHVKDVNDNVPVFTSSDYHFNIEENLPVGSTVGVLAARDRDIGANGELRFSLVNPHANFVINPHNGEITTRQELDREYKAGYELTVRVSDRGFPQNEASTTVQISVLDSNDNAPAFEHSVDETALVEENRPKATRVIQIVAVDPDAMENGTVSYWLDENQSEPSSLKNFAIHPATGWISTREVLDYESKSRYVLTVIARDGGSPARQRFQTITIKVKDDNDEAPLFHARNVSFAITENAPIGTLVGKVTAHDRDSGDNGRVSYYIVSGNVFSLFNVDRNTGHIVSIRDVDYEESSSHTLGIKAIDNNAVYPKSSNISVTIRVVDQNDNAPAFEQDPVVLRTVKENTPVNHVVYTFTATDRDSGVNGTVQYWIARQSSSGPDPGMGSYFTIDPVSGELRVSANIDHEKVHQISLIVETRDSCPHVDCMMNSSVTTIVYVMDVNDNSPVFESRTQVYVFEDEPLDYPVLYVIAVDSDSNENNSGNNVISYEIQSGNSKRKFHLDSMTGLLTIAKPLNREVETSYELTISARDHGAPRRTSYQRLTILVQDVNDNAPRFGLALYRATVRENLGPGVSVLTIQAHDADTGRNGNLTYVIPGGIADDTFSIDPRTGVIITMKTLDREEQSRYNFTAYVHDSGYPTLFNETSVIVEVFDVNDHSPVFKSRSHSVNIPENSPQVSILALVANDEDSGDNAKVTYSIISGNDGHFYINPTTGELSCRSLDREINDTYTLKVMGRDGGSPSNAGHTVVHISIIDVNDNSPRFSLSRYTATIPEDVQKGELVLQVSASDPDYGHNGEVTFAVGNDTEGFFTVNSTSGEITTTGLFDREKKAVYVFDIIAIDGGISGPRSTTARIEISLQDVNDNAPVFKQMPYRKSVSPNTGRGQEILTVSATDPDYGVNSTITYSLDRNSPSGQLFGVSSQGRVTANTDLRRSVGYHNVQVIARDGGSPPLSSTGVVEITVGSSTSPAIVFDQSVYTQRLKEHSPKDTFIIQVRATGTAGIKYSFASGNEDGVFTINPASGNVRVEDPHLLDFETSNTRKLTVVAEAVGKFAYASLWVNLTDINDNPPKFTQTKYFSAIWENNEVETFVTMVQARDADSGSNGRITYSIIQGNTDEAFVIDPPHTGIIKTNRDSPPLDREIHDSYRLVIEAIDHGRYPQSSTCTLRINVNDDNDNEPNFPASADVHISESKEVGSHVTKVTATDVDSDSTLIYDFDRHGNPDSTFSVDRFSGSVSLAKPLDHERRKHYVVGLKVFDGKYNATTTVHIYVDDENDNAPEFSASSYQVSLEELTPPQRSVITLTASDKDAGQNAEITYRMAPTTSGSFYIDSKTGTVFTNKTLTYQTGDSVIQLVITAQDGGKPVLSSMVAVHVQITRINRYMPVFENATYIAYVSEATMTGDLILRVRAHDKDYSSREDNVDYKLENGHGVFQIRRKTGEIFLASHVDRENVAQYDLMVVARDRGNPVKSSSVPLTVFITDVNDNPPHFRQPDSIYHVTLAEGYPSERVFLNVTAEDADEGVHSEILYTITSGNNEGIFFIHGETGGAFIMPKAELDYETATSHRLIVRAVDCTNCPANVPKLSAFVTVDINVTDQNEFPPVFPLSPFEACVYENRSVSTTVFQAQANDGDAGRYGVLTYSIIDDNQDSQYFAIDSQTGHVLTQEVFDYETRNEYSFQIKAEDIEGLADTVVVRVKILDADEYSPVFIRSDYKFYIKGSAKPGDFVGRVQAVDQDGGTAGRVVYRLKYQDDYFKIDSNTGNVTVKLALHDEAPRRRRKRALQGEQKQLTVEASTGMDGSRVSSTHIMIDIDRTCDGCVYIPSTQPGGVDSVVLAVVIVVIVFILVVAAIVFVFCLVRKRRQKQPPPENTSYSESPFTAPNIAPPPLNHQRNGDIFKNKFLHINHNASNVTSSDISEHSHHSASSGRGSAEDDVDEEVQMITESNYLNNSQGYRRKTMPDSGIQQDEDTLSEPSVQTHQEYLAKLGIDSTKIGKPKAVKQVINHSVESMHQFSDEGGGEGNFEGPSDYDKMTDVETDEEVAMIDRNKDMGFHEPDAQNPGSLSSVINSEEEFSGSYNWDYLLNWGPQYQPLAHVFSEIAKLKDDSIQPKTQPVRTVPQQRTNPSLQFKTKTVPPPMITNTPPKAVAPQVMTRPTHTSSSSGSHPHSTWGASTMNTSMPSLPRSPISYESSFTSPALSPSFTPSLSPLAAGSPSPLVSAHANGSPNSSGQNTPGRRVSKQNGHIALSSSGSEREFRI